MLAVAYEENELEDDATSLVRVRGCDASLGSPEEAQSVSAKGGLGPDVCRAGTSDGGSLVLLEDRAAAGVLALPLDSPVEGPPSEGGSVNQSDHSAESVDTEEVSLP